MSEQQPGVLALIGNTPLLRLEGFDTGRCELYLKLENQNPGGSIKDRIGLSMIRAAEREGKLGGGQRHLVEATAGNTGLGVALVMTRSDVEKGHPAHYQDLAEELARREGAFYVNQFANPANPIAHET